MQKWKIVCIGMMLCAVTSVSAQTKSYKERALSYIEQYRQLAIEEQRRSGVPAAITLAQGIHETAAGNSELAVNANNHFGIKCKKEWTGMTYKYTDDAPNECFRKYENPIQSYRDHSDYLANSPRYASLFKLSLTDYAGWATGLKRAGYATNPKYAQLLIKLVEDYKLQDYTYIAMESTENPFKESAEKIKEIRTANNGEIIPTQDAKKSELTASLKTEEYVPPAPAAKKKGMQVYYGNEPNEVKQEQIFTDNPEKPEYGQMVKANGLKAIYVKKGTVLLSEALKHNIRYAKLLELNDLVDGPLEADMYVYLEKKNTKGAHAKHVVKEGETLSQIAQAEGVQLKYLKYYNRIGSNEEPVAGAVLSLQEYNEVKPETYVKTIAPREEPAFAGSSPAPIPQGSTRKRANYISKEEIANGGETSWSRKEQAAHAEKVSIADEPAVEEQQVFRRNDSEDMPEEKDEEEIVAAPANEHTDTPEIQNAAIEEKKLEVRTDEVAATVEETATKVASEEIIKAGEETPLPQSEPIAKAEPAPVPTEIPELPAMPVTSAELVESKAAPEVETATEARETKEKELKEPEQLATEEVKPKTEEAATLLTEPKTETAAAVMTEEIAAVEGKKEEAASTPVIAPTTENEENAVVTDAPNTETEQPNETVASSKATDEKPKEEAPAEPEEPQDEFSRLKRKLDKVVYASDKVASAQPATPAKAEAKTEAKTDEKKPSATPVKDETGSKVYVVKKGDTAFGIAKKHNISISQLNEWNKLDFKGIKVGQKLKVKQ